MAVVLCRFDAETAGRICRRLRCSNECEGGVVWLIGNLPRVIDVDSLELADVKLLIADARFQRLAQMLYAECRGRLNSVSPHEMLLARAARIPPERVAPPPLVGGDDLRAGTDRPSTLFADDRVALGER